MLSKSLAVLSLLSSAATAETVVGVYMFHRHGDRTSKSTPPTELTDLGYTEVYDSGTYYRNRYIDSNASTPIYGIAADLVTQSQIAASAPSDTVLQNSATGFLQGLYPPVGEGLGSQTLRNGTNSTSPLNGYQLIPVNLASGGDSSESSGWLEGATGCNAATVSSDEYFYSTEYLALKNSTATFYTDLLPVVNRTFNESQMSYKNAYTIYDLINVAEIHNTTIQDADLITNSTFHQLLTLANNHEWNLGYNASNNARAIDGMTLAAEIVKGLNTTITGSGATKFQVQFGAYGSFGSFFGLANLTAADEAFYGIVNYASSMVFELVTNATVSQTSFPTADDISVRFLFHNGTAMENSPPIAYPLFGGSDELLSWSDFAAGMDEFAVGTEEAWCSVCQNTTGACAAYSDSSSSGSSSSNSSSSSGSGSGSSSSTSDSKKSGNGLSPAVNGVIGAMVTLAVVLGIEALVLLIGGMRVVSKKRLAGGQQSASVAHAHEPKA